MHEEAHQATSRRLLGRDFAEVHAYLDRYYWEFGTGHRCVLHHRRGIEKIVERFGEDAREPAELHILEDLRLTEKIDGKNRRKLAGSAASDPGILEGLRRTGITPPGAV